MKHLKLALVLGFGLVLICFHFAAAHSFIDHCTPEVGSTIPQPPKELRCSFTEAIDAKQTVLAVFDANNNQLDNGDLKSDPNDPNGTTVVETLNSAKMTAGLYTVKWSTVSEDGHATDGQFQFAMAAQPATAAGSPAAPTAGPTATTTTAPAASPTPTSSGPSNAPAVAAAPASIVISAPDESSAYPNDPTDVTIDIQVKNFVLGQGSNRWQVYLDGKLAIQVMDGNNSAVLHSVPKGDHWIKVALATGDNTVVATAGTGVGVGPGDGDIPATALSASCEWRSLGGGNDTWYKIPYIKGTQLEITLDDNGAGIGFDVWDPFQVQTWGTPDQVLPVGSGSPNPAETAHDLTWAGHLQDDGTYYVHLTNNDAVKNPYRLCSAPTKLP